MRNHSMLLACTGTVCAGAMALLVAMPVAAAGYNVSERSCISDNADILSSDTETMVENLSIALQDACGAQIGVYTVENIGNTDLEQYTYEVFNAWGLGDAQKDNGVLLVLTPGDDNYIAVQGEGLETTLPTSTLQNILNRDMEDNWVAGNFDAGTQATVKAIAKELVSIYSLNMDVDSVARGDSDDKTAVAAPKGGGGMSGLGTLVLIILVLVVIIVVVRAVSRPTRRRTYNSNYGGNFGARRRYYTPPPQPRNYGNGGFGGMGGFGNPRPGPGFGFGGGASSRPSNSRPSSGSGFSFGGGSSSSGHIPSRPSGGIHSGGGSFRAGGGSTRGGGARRGG